MKKRKVIIAVHGLKNKPPKWLLRIWWKKSVREGLKYINKKKCFFKFKMAYWADIRYQKTLLPFIYKRNNPCFLDEPYTKMKKIYRGSILTNLKIKILDNAEIFLDKLFFKKYDFFNINLIFDRFIKRLFADLDIYYNKDSESKNNGVKERIQNRLILLLEKYKDHDILLIGHSMGSIIAYDTLRYKTPGIKIHTLITIGSPLGLPYVIKKILEHDGHEYKEGMKLPSPDNIQKSWYNLSDPDDKVAIIYNLNNNYQTNSNQISPVDIAINNDYEYKKKKNPHKSYGYLRNPKTAEIINKFLNEN